MLGYIKGEKFIYQLSNSELLGLVGKVGFLT
jgi:hypothetical protein